MKKIYKKLNDLAFDDINYPNENYISAWDIVNVYLKGLNNSQKDLIESSSSDIFKKTLGKDIDCTLEYSNEKKLKVTIHDNEEEKEVLFYFDCLKSNNIYLTDAIYDQDYYRIGDLEMLKGIVFPEVKKYVDKYELVFKTYDQSHGGMTSVNSNFYIYLVDNEVIIFPGNYSHMICTMDENAEVNIDCKNMEIISKLGLTGLEEQILKNVYFNIEDAPIFLREDLYNRRQEILKQEDGMTNSKNTSLKRVLKKIKKEEK